MLIIPNNSKVFLALTPIDFRKQISGLKKWIGQELLLDPLSGAFFIFMAANKKSIKIMHYDGQGSCLYTKKLAVGKFKGLQNIYDMALKYTAIHQLEAQLIYMNGSANQLQFGPNWP